MTLAASSFGRECLWVEDFDEHFETEGPARGRITGKLTEGRSGRGFKSEKPGDHAVFDSEGRLNVQEGTIDLWVQPNWDGGGKTERVLFDIVGSPPHWNRFTIGVHPHTGRLIFDIVCAKETVENIWNADRYILADISNWKKGQWQRITATWKNVNSGKADAIMELFINGKKRGRRTGDRIAITELGDKIFIGASAEGEGKLRFWDGVIDEVAVYDRAKTQEEISGEGVLKTALLYSRGELELLWNLKPLLGRLPSSAKAVAEVYRATDRKILSSLPLSGPSEIGRICRATLDITHFPPGKYTVKAYVKDGKKMIAEGSARFDIPQKPVWWGNKLGISDEVLPPWTPVKVSGSTVSVWARDYRFANGPFPSQIVTKGKPILAAPMELQVITERGPLEWRNHQFECLSQTDAKAKLAITNKSPSIDLTAAVEVEFDGFVRVDLKISPKKPTIIENLSLKIPLNRENALYMKAERPWDWREKEYAWYAACLYQGAKGKEEDTLVVNRKWHFSAKGWIWPDRFMHYVWVGGDEAGISVTFDSDKNWQTSKYVEVAETEGTREIRFNLIDSAYQLEQPLDYTLALQATPVKPLPRDTKKWRYGWRGEQTPVGHEEMEIACQYRLLRGPAWPELTQKGKDLIRVWKEGGVRLVPDYYTNVTTLEMPEFQTFGAEWKLVPEHTWGWSGGAHATMVCLKGSYADFLLWGLNKLIDEGLRGLYIDSRGVQACTNQYGGCGYVDKDGVRKPTINLFEVREAYKRIYTLFKTRVPDSFIFHHTTPITPLVSFVDATTEGEEWTDFKVGDVTYLTPDFFRCGYMVNQTYGAPFCLYPGLPRGFPKQVKQADLIPLTLSHNTFPIYMGAYCPLAKQVWKIMDQWYTSSEWIPYWKNAHLVNSFADEVKVSLYRKPNDRSLIIVANLGNDAKQGRVGVNLSGFGLTGHNYKLTSLGLDSPDGEATLVDGKLAVSLPAHSLRFFLLEKR